MILSPMGDRAVLAQFGDTIDPDTNRLVQAFSAAAKTVPGVTEVLPTYCSAMVCYDPAVIGYDALCARLRELKADGAAAMKYKIILRVPCLYNGQDMDDMQRLTGLTRQEIISLHSGTDYRIYMLGFLPGFVYLGGLDERLHAPRLTTPRKAIPAGAVGIGGAQTGIYPMASPGGWRLIGTTPLVMYDPHRTPQVLCAAGEYIRFEPVTETEFDMIERGLRAGTYRPKREVWQGVKA